MFTWKPIFSELAHALLPFRHRQLELIGILKEIRQANPPNFPIIRLIDNYKPATEPPLSVIDPFTFFANINRGLKHENRITILSALQQKFSLKSPIPSDFAGIPLIDARKSWFFPYGQKRRPRDIDDLWDLATSALSNTPDKLDPHLFNRCLEIDTVGPAKLTMGLFWINPDNYIALDDNNLQHFARSGITEDATDHASYVAVVKQVIEKLGVNFPAISYEAWQMAKNNPARYWAGGSTWGETSKVEEFVSGNFWQIGWDKNDDSPAAKRTWKLFADIKVGDEFAIKGLGGRYDLKIYYLGQVLHKSDDGTLKLRKLHRPLYSGKGPTGPSWFEALLPITNQSAIDAIFHSREQDSEEATGDAESEPCAPALPAALNTILYGPPGTGKTYRLRKHYMKAFEGSAAVPMGNEHAASLVRELSWWEVAALALLAAPQHKATVSEILQHPLVQARLEFSANKHPSQVIWRMLGSHAKKDCPHVNCSARTEPLLFSKDADSIWSIDATLADSEAPHLRGILANFLEPQASETVDRFAFTTFHQSFSYEDFVEGIKPQAEEEQGGDNTKLSYEVRLGVFREICRRAEANPSNNYAVFIDEINRGNVASIFGELITAIEDDKRLGKPNELKITLPYSREAFGVPANLYIIGTMNTADRSVEALDTALRRRFTFEEMRPDADKITQPPGLQVDLRKLFETINARIERLLDHDHCIGHYYFMGIKDLSDLQTAFANKLIPLLREYFYGNPAKVGMILGQSFVTRKNVPTPFAPGSWGADELDEKEVFVFSDVHALEAKAFENIYADHNQGL